MLMVEPIGAARGRIYRKPPGQVGAPVPLSGAQGQECALTSGHLLLQGQFLLTSLRGAEGLLSLLPEEQVPEGRAAEDVGGGADQRRKRL